jgi:hypothetical protein
VRGLGARERVLTAGSRRVDVGEGSCGQSVPLGGFGRAPGRAAESILKRRGAFGSGVGGIGLTVCHVLALVCGVMPADARFVGNELLGRPTDTSVTVHMFPAVDVSVYVTYGAAGGSLDSVTPAIAGPAGEPVEIVLDGLSPNTAYEYIVWRRDQTSDYEAGPLGHFHTQRSTDDAFVFTVTADAHVHNKLWPEPDEPRLALLQQAFENVSAADGDFHIMLGDDVGMESCQSSTGCVSSVADARSRYLDVRLYLDQFEGSLPVFRVLGNHEGEQGWRLDGTCYNLAQLGFRGRKQVVPNPLPDAFYSGNGDVDPCNGLRGDYYAWEWGDALFVALDPFWYTTTRPHSRAGGEGSEDSWDWTLGEEQYAWLSQTLANSTKQWKFICIHHLTGGVNPYGRGGIEAVSHALGGHGSYEWGGENVDGSWGFAERRPGWSMPIHELLVAQGVTMVLHGHDHLYAKQQLDGIYYQECPVPGNDEYHWGHRDDGLYTHGLLMRNSGHLEVQVSPVAVWVDYIRAYLPGDGVNGELAHRYIVSSGDFDRDGDVDLSDYGSLLNCYNGPSTAWLGDESCATFDTDNDGDVDLSDYGVFVSCFNGPGRLPSCE